jgi:hypothetical protein
MKSTYNWNTETHHIKFQNSSQPQLKDVQLHFVEDLESTKQGYIFDKGNIYPIVVAAGFWSFLLTVHIRYEMTWKNIYKLRQFQF